MALYRSPLSLRIILKLTSGSVESIADRDVEIFMRRMFARLMGFGEIFFQFFSTRSWRRNQPFRLTIHNDLPARNSDIDPADIGLPFMMVSRGRLDGDSTAHNVSVKGSQLLRLLPYALFDRFGSCRVAKGDFQRNHHLHRLSSYDLCFNRMKMLGKRHAMRISSSSSAYRE